MLVVTLHASPLLTRLVGQGQRGQRKRSPVLRTRPINYPMLPSYLAVEMLETGRLVLSQLCYFRANSSIQDWPTWHPLGDLGDFGRLWETFVLQVLKCGTWMENFVGLGFIVSYYYIPRSTSRRRALIRTTTQKTTTTKGSASTASNVGRLNYIEARMLVAHSIPPSEKSLADLAFITEYGVELCAFAVGHSPSTVVQLF